MYFVCNLVSKTQLAKKQDNTQLKRAGEAMFRKVMFRTSNLGVGTKKHQCSMTYVMGFPPKP